MRIPVALPLAALFALSLVGCQSDGGAYLESLPVKPTMITKATVE